MLNLSGCTGIVSKEWARDPATEPDFDMNKVIGVMTTSGEKVEFDRNRRRALHIAIRSDSLHSTVDKRPFSVALADIERIHVIELRKEETVVTAVVLVAVGAFVVSFLKNPMRGSSLEPSQH